MQIYMTANFKCHILSWQIPHYKRQLAYFEKHGVRITYRKNVMYLHIPCDKPYTVLLNMLLSFKCKGMLSCNDKSLNFLAKYTEPWKKTKSSLEAKD